MSGENEYTLKDVVGELKTVVSNLNDAVTGIKVLIANEYVKKSDCELCKEQISKDKEKFGKDKESNDIAHGQLINWIIGTYVLIVGGVGAVLTYLQLRGK